MAEVSDTTEAMWKKTLAVNVMGVVHGTQAFLGHMKARPQASCIINISSQASWTPYVYMSAYATSKYAVEGFTDALRIDLAMGDSKVSVISIHPGVINTRIIPAEGASFSKQAMNNLQAKYENTGSPPSVVAKDIVNAVKRDKACVMSGSKATLGFWANKLLSKKTIAKVIVRDAIKTRFTLDA